MDGWWVWGGGRPLGEEVLLVAEEGVQPVVVLQAAAQLRLVAQQQMQLCLGQGGQVGGGGWMWYVWGAGWRCTTHCGTPQCVVCGV